MKQFKTNLPFDEIVIGKTTLTLRCHGARVASWDLPPLVGDDDVWTFDEGIEGFVSVTVGDE